jgi:hypothetical protein
MESQMWSSFQKVFKAFGDLVRIENAVAAGTPDVNYCFHGCEGWIEFKEVAEWPPNGGPLRVPHFTPRQRLWLRRRRRAGGRAWLLLRVRATSEWLLFDGAVAAELLGTSAREVLQLAARVSQVGLAHPSQLLTVLKH